MNFYLINDPQFISKNHELKQIYPNKTLFEIIIFAKTFQLRVFLNNISLIKIIVQSFSEIEA